MLSVIPVRLEPVDLSEMVSQVLFGEHFEIIESDRQWRKIRLAFDAYCGWIDFKQLQPISEEQFNKLENSNLILSNDLVSLSAKDNGNYVAILQGSCLNFINFYEPNFVFDGSFISTIQPKSAIIETAYAYLGAPYLWGGKTIFGIDCSGFTQMVYKLCGYKLLRDASQQASQGESLSFIEESEPGDLAFFDNEDGKIIHVGIMLQDNYIIHASGEVRIDRLDHLGIYNVKTRKHTHKLRVIKKII
jgi:hypothetical protein